MSPHTRTTRRGAGFATGAALALLLTACSGGTSVGGDQPAGDAGGEAAPTVDGLGDVEGTIRVAYWGSGPRVELTNGVSELFMAEYPEVTVESEFADFGAHFERLNVQAASGNMPCLPQMQGRQLNDYTTRDVLMPLDPLIESGAINVDDISPAILDTGRGLDGNLYMIPYGAAYNAMAINQTLAEQAGVGVPEEGYTWDDFEAYLREAQPGLPEGIEAVGLGGNQPNNFIAWVLGNGESLFEGTEIGFEEQTLVDFWTYWQDLQEDGITNTPQEAAEEPEQTEQRYVAQGEVMVDQIPGNALTPAQETLEGTGTGQQLTTVALPAGEAGSGDALFTSGFAIAASCDNVPAAAAYIDFWANDDEAAALFASNNGAVTNSEHLQQQLDNPDLSETQRRELELFQEIIASDPPAAVYPPGYQANFEGAFVRYADAVAFGQQSPEEAAAAFIAEVNAALGSQ